MEFDNNAYTQDEQHEQQHYDTASEMAEEVFGNQTNGPVEGTHGEDDAELMVLRDMVSKTLETRGVLGAIRAQLRAAVFSAMEEQERACKPGTTAKALFSEQPAHIRAMRESDEGHVLIGLVLDFLDVFGFESTSLCFRAELGPLLDVFGNIDGNRGITSDAGASNFQAPSNGLDADEGIGETPHRIEHAPSDIRTELSYRVGIDLSVFTGLVGVQPHDDEVKDSAVDDVLVETPVLALVLRAARNYQEEQVRGPASFGSGETDTAAQLYITEHHSSSSQRLNLQQHRESEYKATEERLEVDVEEGEEQQQQQDTQASQASEIHSARGEEQILSVETQSESTTSNIFPAETHVSASQGYGDNTSDYGDPNDESTQQTATHVDVHSPRDDEFLNASIDTTTGPRVITSSSYDTSSPPVSPRSSAIAVSTADDVSQHSARSVHASPSVSTAPSGSSLSRGAPPPLPPLRAQAGKSHSSVSSSAYSGSDKSSSHSAFDDSHEQGGTHSAKKSENSSASSSAGSNGRESQSASPHSVASNSSNNSNRIRNRGAKIQTGTSPSSVMSSTYNEGDKSSEHSTDSHEQEAHTVEQSAASMQSVASNNSISSRNSDKSDSSLTSNKSGKSSQTRQKTNINKSPRSRSASPSLTAFLSPQKWTEVGLETGSDLQNELATESLSSSHSSAVAAASVSINQNESRSRSHSHVSSHVSAQSSIHSDPHSRSSSRISTHSRMMDAVSPSSAGSLNYRMQLDDVDLLNVGDLQIPNKTADSPAIAADVDSSANASRSSISAGSLGAGSLGAGSLGAGSLGAGSSGADVDSVAVHAGAGSIDTPGPDEFPAISADDTASSATCNAVKEENVTIRRDDESSRQTSPSSYTSQRSSDHSNSGKSHGQLSKASSRSSRTSNAYESATGFLEDRDGGGDNRESGELHATNSQYSDGVDKFGAAGIDAADVDTFDKADEVDTEGKTSSTNTEYSRQSSPSSSVSQRSSEDSRGHKSREQSMSPSSKVSSRSRTSNDDVNHTRVVLDGGDADDIYDDDFRSEGLSQNSSAYSRNSNKSHSRSISLSSTGNDPSRTSNDESEVVHGGENDFQNEKKIMAQHEDNESVSAADSYTKDDVLFGGSELFEEQSTDEQSAGREECDQNIDAQLDQFLEHTDVSVDEAGDGEEFEIAVNDEAASESGSEIGGLFDNEDQKQEGIDKPNEALGVGLLSDEESDTERGLLNDEQETESLSFEEEAVSFEAEEFEENDERQKQEQDSRQRKEEENEDNTWQQQEQQRQEEVNQELQQVQAEDERQQREQQQHEEQRLEQQNERQEEEVETHKREQQQQDEEQELGDESLPSERERPQGQRDDDDESEQIDDDSFSEGPDSSFEIVDSSAECGEGNVNNVSDDGGNADIDSTTVRTSAVDVDHNNVEDDVKSSVLGDDDDSENNLSTESFEDANSRSLRDGQDKQEQVQMRADQEGNDNESLYGQSESDHSSLDVEINETRVKDTQQQEEHDYDGVEQQQQQAEEEEEEESDEEWDDSAVLFGQISLGASAAAPPPPSTDIAADSHSSIDATSISGRSSGVHDIVSPTGDQVDVEVDGYVDELDANVDIDADAGADVSNDVNVDKEEQHMGSGTEREEEEEEDEYGEGYDEDEFEDVDEIITTMDYDDASTSAVVAAAGVVSAAAEGGVDGMAIGSVSESQDEVKRKAVLADAGDRNDDDDDGNDYDDDDEFDDGDEIVSEEDSIDDNLASGGVSDDDDYFNS